MVLLQELDARIVTHPEHEGNAVSVASDGSVQSNARRLRHRSGPVTLRILATSSNPDPFAFPDFVFRIWDLVFCVFVEAEGRSVVAVWIDLAAVGTCGYSRILTFAVDRVPLFERVCSRRPVRRRRSQVVRQRSAKPLFPGSNPGGASFRRTANCPPWGRPRPHFPGRNASCLSVHSSRRSRLEANDAGRKRPQGRAKGAESRRPLGRQRKDSLSRGRAKRPRSGPDRSTDRLEW
jgi:hypothetical protein